MPMGLQTAKQTGIYSAVIYHSCIVHVCINQHASFQVPSFTDSKDVIGTKF